MEELEKRHAQWCKRLQRAVETDGWGQVVEAVDAYERLAVQLMKDAPHCHELSTTQVRTIESVAGSLELRAKRLSSVVDGEDTSSPTKDDMDDILEVLCSVLSDAPQVFPLDLGNVRRPTKRASTVQVVEADDVDGNDADALAIAAAALALDAEAAAATASLHTAAVAVRRVGETYLSVQVAKIGLKDAPTYTNPTVVVSVFDRDGRPMGDKVETQVGEHSSTEPLYVSFESSARIELAPSLEAMNEHGATIFFEFYHYKPKKRKQSCRCWAMLEMDEVPTAANDTDNSGDRVLELYVKPMDPTRKRIHLFTIKELYLHVTLTRHTHVATTT